MSVQLREVILFEILACIDIGSNLEDEAGALEVGAEEVKMRGDTRSVPTARQAPPPGPGPQ